MSKSDVYEVLALRYASLAERTRRQHFLSPDPHDAPHPIDYYVWVVRNARRTILVDTGFDRAEAQRRSRKITYEPREILKLIGIEAADVANVVLTHMHYDHAGSLDHFPAANLHVQDSEIAYCTGRCMGEAVPAFPFSAEHVCQLVRRNFDGKVVFHDGDEEIAPGVSVHRIGGHSAGLQAVRVATQRGPVVLASDAAHFYETLAGRNPFPILVDMREMMAGYHKLEALSPSRAHIVPGHDPLVAQRYPALNRATEGIVHRLDVAPKE